MELIKKLLALVGIRLPAPSVASALSVFSKAVAKLDEAVAHHSALSKLHDDAIAATTKLRDAATAEAVQAETYARRVKNLIGL